MKKILSFLLVATMLCALFVLPSAADDKINYKVDAPYVKTAPKIDGVVKKGEYGKALPLHTYSEDKSQFSDKEHNDYGDGAVDVDFHMAWDKNNLYMAWVVESDTHGGLPEKHFDPNTGAIIEGDFTEADYGWMWKYSCIQFIFTPGVPDAGKKQFQTSEWSGNYLEVGLCLTDSGKQCRIAWSKPAGAEALDPNDWDAVIVRDEKKKTTTYEVRIPWNKSGLKEAGNKAQFGLTYAVGFQSSYDEKKGMIEWQDGMLSGKNADNAAVVTLTGNEAIQVSTISSEAPKPPVLEDGQLPATVTDETVKLTLDGINTAIAAESSSLFTSVGAMNNTNWATCLLLKPLGNDKYALVETKVGDGSAVAFETAETDGMIVAAFHSDGAENSAGKARKDAAAALQVGTELTLFGVNVTEAKQTYKNSMLYVSGEAGDNPVDDSSAPDESSEAESSAVVEESSKVVEESKTSSAAESSKSDDEGGSLVWLWIVLAIVVVAVVAAVVVVVLKKKKAQ